MKSEVDSFAGLLGPGIGFAVSLSDSSFFETTLEDLCKSGIKSKIETIRCILPRY